MPVFISPIPAGDLEVPLLLTFSVKSERLFELMKSFVNDLYEYDYTGEQAKNEESSGDEEIDIQITVEENLTNENKNVNEIFISSST